MSMVVDGRRLLKRHGRWVDAGPANPGKREKERTKRLREGREKKPPTKERIEAEVEAKRREMEIGRGAARRETEEKAEQPIPVSRIKLIYMSGKDEVFKAQGYVMLGDFVQIVGIGGDNLNRVMIRADSLARIEQTHSDIAGA